MCQVTWRYHLPLPTSNYSQKTHRIYACTTQLPLRNFLGQEVVFDICKDGWKFFYHHSKCLFQDVLIHIKIIVKILAYSLKITSPCETPSMSVFNFQYHCLGILLPHRPKEFFRAPISYLLSFDSRPNDGHFGFFCFNICHNVFNLSLFLKVVNILLKSYRSNI